MNKGRIAGLILVALVAAWLVLRSCTPAEPPPTSPTAPAREVFHASKPIQIKVTIEPDETGKAPDMAWLAYELRHLLNRGQMRVAPVMPETPASTFTLQLDISKDARQATFALVAPDRVVERRVVVKLKDSSRLATMRAIAGALPQFLQAAHASADWVALIGTDDAKAYDTFVSSAMELLGAAGQGFTEPPNTPQRTRTVERLEALARSQPRFARARATLATGYLSLGGEDENSLTQLAESSAQRALALDEQLAEAHAALGLVHLRRNEWVASREQFERALSLDASDAPALEGLACLLTDAGRYTAALPIAEHAVFVQPGNIGARECLAYARTVVSDHPSSDATAPPTPSDRVRALDFILGGDNDSARQLLTKSLAPEEFAQWAEPLLRAAGNKRDIPDALKSITLAASDASIDPATEILCGAALRQSDFVFNRMSRLQRERQHVPLRILWMPRTAFLRKHPRFAEITTAAGLPAFWQEYGAPDVCATEPKLRGCKVATAAKIKSKQ